MQGLIHYALLFLNYQSSKLVWRSQWQKYFLPAHGPDLEKLGLQLIALAITVCRACCRVEL